MVSNLTNNIEKEANDARDSGRMDVKWGGFNPREGYDPKTLADTNYTQKKIYKYGAAIQKDPLDVQAGKDFAKKVFGNESHYADENGKTDLWQVKHDSEQRMQEYRDSESRWAFNNRHTLLDRLREEDKDGSLATSIVLSTPLFNTDGEDRAHDFLVSQITRLGKLQQIANEENTGIRHKGMYEEIQRYIKMGKISQTSVYLMQFEGQRQVEKYFNMIMQEQGKVVQRILTPNRAINLLEKEIEIAESAYRDNRWDSGDRTDEMRASLTPLLTAITDKVYEKDKAKDDADKIANDEKERKKNKAENKYRRMGLKW